MNILITGSNGFIGKNLYIKLKEKNYNNIETFNSNDNFNKLEGLINRADIIFHCAGVNRPCNNIDFKKNNVDLTAKIAKYLRMSNNKNKIIHFTSSIHVNGNNDYGLSKIESENILINDANRGFYKVLIYRLPNIFGKWCLPNYNSVVATFCYNIINKHPINISDPNKIISLYYIDDLINLLINKLSSKISTYKIINIKKTYKISLFKLSEIIKSFNSSRKSLEILDVGVGFKRALYATFLSYIDDNNFSYKLSANTDVRGSFVEFIKSKKSGQISLLKIKINQIRGRHYHHTKSEKFFLITGVVKVTFINILNYNKKILIINSKDYPVIDTIPGWYHEFENIGECDANFILWASELFNSNNADTYSINEKL